MAQNLLQTFEEKLEAAASAVSVYHIDGVAIPMDDVMRDASIMIIDDEQLNIDVAETYLEDAGYHRFHSTTESVTAIEQIR
ncbi:MAG: hypothetical protein KDB27_33885 [Planctomycetales bacterium]|nr:hypothetical protein [Planctomycetales bacterium]